ncbi:hypothetical protein PSPO01_15343, partial [Paraphaeosphaeria sporulosa]
SGWSALLLCTHSTCAHNTREERAAQDAEKATKKAAREAKKAAKNMSMTGKANSSRQKPGRKRKSAALEHEAGGTEQQAKARRTSDTRVTDIEASAKPYRAPEARMY